MTGEALRMTGEALRMTGEALRMTHQRGVTNEESLTRDTKRKQHVAAEDEALLRLYPDEFLKNALHRRHQ